MEDRPFMTIKEIEDYGENSVSPVNYLILESLGEVSKILLLLQEGMIVWLPLSLCLMPLSVVWYLTSHWTYSWEIDNMRTVDGDWRIDDMKKKIW